jgi:hypothetical protein
MGADRALCGNPGFWRAYYSLDDAELLNPPSVPLAMGVPITYVAAQMGHTTQATPLRFYAWWLPKEGRRYVDLLLRPAAEAPHPDQGDPRPEGRSW